MNALYFWDIGHQKTVTEGHQKPGDLIKNTWLPINDYVIMCPCSFWTKRHVNLFVNNNNNDDDDQQ